ncbi:hypothetical protein AB6A40_004932 [Gnathostoma spinigerum]|uniref:Fibronectin type-III domain-containing protein n=1 Tax=Gnathostoma spinigerum TaxID=75299 RepID=A0ABD6EMN4_9BILA
MEEEMIIEKIGVQHDRIRFRWTVPESLRSKLTIIRVAASIVQGGTSIPLRSIAIRPNETSYYFDKLLGNTTYRISVEGFSESESLLYASSLITTSLADLDWLPAPTDVTLADKSSDSLEITWTTPVVSSESKQSMVNQHVVTVYKFSLIDRIGIEKQRIIIRFPYTRVLLEDLEPRSVYNVTIQAGSDFGYGDMAWAVHSTLDIGEAFILRLFSRTPNSLTLKWQKSWLNGPDYSYTIRASTIHSLDGSVKEIAMSGSLGARQDPYHKLMNLTPGSAYNVTLSTIEERRKRYGVRRVKTIWAVFSTLKQGEYVVTSPRLAATTDLSASIVWQKIDHEKPVDYQIQYTLLTGNGMSTILDPLPENHCKCPKMSCDWLCALVFNLHRRPQDHAFQIRAKVDGIWNKWVPVVERPWSIMERACSINPPPFFVDHLNDTDYMRLIEFGNVDAFDTKTWRYVVVVDQRGGVDSSLSAIDISQLSDKATAEHNEVPYYITAAITPEEIKQWTSFRKSHTQ